MKNIENKRSFKKNINIIIETINNYLIIKFKKFAGFEPTRVAP